MTTDQLPVPTVAPANVLALSSNYGSVAGWRASFIALADAHANSNVKEPGCVELAFVADKSELVNRWRAGEPVADPMVVLAMPMPADAQAFVAGIDPAPACLRHIEAVHATSAPFAAPQADVMDDAKDDASDDAGEVLLLDVRRAGIFETANIMLPGASWRDPSRVADWAPQLPAVPEVIVDCVRGHEVGRVTAMRLQAQRVNARFLDGGIDAWQRAGLRVITKGNAP